MLLQFDQEKVLKSRFFLIVLCLILCANLLLNSGLRPWCSYCLKMRDFSGDEPTFPNFIAQQRKNAGRIASEYHPFTTMSKEEKAAFEDSMETEHGKDVFLPILICRLIAIPPIPAPWAKH